MAGASGGYIDSNYYSGLGAKTSGYIELEEGEKLYFYVGGKGSSITTPNSLISGGYNGGGDALTQISDNSSATSGGGATDVRLVGGSWNNTASLISRIMVAAGGVWSSNYLSFDGVDDHVMVAEINPDVLTIEAVYAATDQSVPVMIGNIHTGGYAVAMDASGYVKGMYYIGDGYKEVFSSEQVKLNEKKLVSTSYDSNTIRLFINGFLESSLSQTGAIVKPGSSTYLAIGANPIGSTVNTEYYNGKIYSVRIYNRPLTDEEVLHNYLYDKQIFNLD